MNVQDISFHYTSEEMARDLTALVPLIPGDQVLDAGSGKNKVWFNNLPDFCLRDECEIEDGRNFYEWAGPADWVIGNPPYHESWKFTEHALKVAKKGVAWLLNNQAMNSHLTPRRLENLKKMGWNITKIHVVADRRWFGRYMFVVLERSSKRCEITWNTKTY